VQEHLLVEMYARGLSTRDVEDCFRDESGRSMISRTAVSEIVDQLWEDFQEFCSRDLSGFAFNRGIHFDDGDRGPVGAWIASPESGGSVAPIGRRRLDFDRHSDDLELGIGHRSVPPRSARPPAGEAAGRYVPNPSLYGSRF
jgi:hypothetical protein